MAGDLQAMIDAVASPVRREILWLTWDAELAVGDIGAHFDITAPTLSSHLGTLRDAGLVAMRIDGNFRRYRCNQEAVRALVPLLAADDDRWVAADDTAERELAATVHGRAVVTAVEVPVDQGTAFEAFTDGSRYSRWLGAPVSIRNRRFRATLEWGTEIRGTYEVISPPDLIAMRWDFEDGTVPLPGRSPLVTYLRVEPTRLGSRVEVHQLARNEREATFFADAWATVLGRFAEAHGAAPSDAEPAAAKPRPARPKRSKESR